MISTLTHELPNTTSLLHTIMWDVIAEQSFNQSSGDFVCTNKFYMNSLFSTKILFLSICSKFRDIRRHSDKDHTLRSIVRCVLQIKDDSYIFRYFILF